MSGPNPRLTGDVPRRSASVQQLPPSDLSGFPEATIPPPHSWFREHGRRAGSDGGCWFFSGHRADQEPRGRFDLPQPHGTCYLSETPSAAARERCGRLMAAGAPIPPGHYRDRVVSEVRAPAGAVRIADATDASAVHHYQVTRELFSYPDYVLTSRWAAAFHLSGFDALLYEPRFGPGPGRAVALFGIGGSDPGRPVLASVDLVHVLRGMCLLPATPSSSEIPLDDADAEPAQGVVDTD